MEKVIEELRADAEKTIERIIDYLNTYYKDCTKEKKNEAIEFMLLCKEKFMNNKEYRYSFDLIDFDEEKSIPVINRHWLMDKASEIIEKRTESLRRALLDKEMRFIELDNIMEINGYYSLLDDGVTSYIKRHLNVVYTAEGTEKPEIEISFIITEDTEVDEMEENFRLIVTDVKGI